MELQVVPSFPVELTPPIAIIPHGATVERDLRVTVSYGGLEPVSGVVELVLPDGWEQTPDRALVEFTREDEARTVLFSVKPAAGVAIGEYPIGASF